MKRMFIILFVTAAFLSVAHANRLRVWTIAGGAHSARIEAEEILRSVAGDNLILLDIAGLQQRLAQVPGITDAHVRRRLPDGLEVSLTPRHPLAVWGGGGLVDVRGRRYDGVADRRLPIFHGPENRAASMADFYGAARKILSPLEIAVIQIEVGDDGEWRVYLQDGVMLNLGREHRHERMRRYARYAEVLQRRFARIKAVDLRYERGFSVTGEKEEV